MDRYTRRARLYPVYLLVFPLALPLVALSWGPAAWWGRLAALAAACGLPLMAAQVGRSAGKRKEPALFAAWGGMPTTALLRHRSSTNPTALARRHELISRATGVALPSPAEEHDHPEAADAAYETAVAALREQTRDQERFPLVFDELCNYGFRRNLWGHRALGIAVALGSVIVILGVAVLGAVGAVRISGPTALAVALVDSIIVAVWVRMITVEWVREAADAYAERLLSSAERLDSQTRDHSL